MSSSNRAASKGGKSAKADKSHKSDKSEKGKSGGDKQQHKDSSNKSEDSSIKDKVKMLIEMTERSEEEVCLALHECDYDPHLAINMIFETMGTGEWVTREKKKKNRQASAGKKGDKENEEQPVTDDWAPEEKSMGTRDDKEKSRGSRGGNSGGPPRLHGRGWRGRERQENERNQDDRDRSEFRDRDRRGRPGGPTRGGGGRGRGGGRAGGRYPPRGNRSNTYNKPIDTWDNSNTWDNSTAVTTNHNVEESWDDFPGADEWSTEEYQGSLADTKVFTPSVSAPPTTDSIADPPGLQEIEDQQGLQMGPSVTQQTTLQRQSPIPVVGSLTTAQSQYFSQLQQNNDPLNKQYGTTQTFQSQTFEKTTSASPYNTTPAVSQSYNTQQYASPSNTYSNQSSTYTNQSNAYTNQSNTYPNQANTYANQSNTYANSGYQPVSNSYGSVQAEQPPTQQPTRTKTQRARVPPPSKIPSSAVEMPGDLNSSIGYLDVQFGAMDLIDTNSSFDGSIEGKLPNNLETSTTPAANLDLNTSNQNSALDAYSPKTNAQSSISSALSQSLSNPDAIPQTTEHLTSAYSSAPRNTTQASVAAPVAAVPAVELSKQQESLSYSQPSTYNAYQSKTNTYNSSTYSGTQTSSSYPSNQNSAYVNNQSGGYNPPSGNAYQNAYSSNNSYQSTANSNTFPSISQSNVYPTNNQSYQQNTSQSVYGANTGLNSSSNYGSAATSQYNSYSSNNKLVKDTSYETNASTTSSSQTTTTHVTSTAALTPSTVGTSKTSTTLAKSSNSIVSNIPPGVTPVMSTPYIMGQVPYFPPQQVYSYEDMQLLQQRLPHMTTPYYDMSYQTTPTTLAAVRGDAAGVGYSLGGDGRFARADNNASPAPATPAQQTQTQQQQQAQPILAGAAPPFYFATAFNTIPNYQFGTMYTQLPAATNAHGSSNSTQYPKPATYGSGYGSYDALSQSQDYTKGGYVSNTQGQKGTGANASSTGSAGSDLSAMYAKSHTALGKVNSYEKQGFHSGTPPPFTGAIHGSQNAGLAPSGTGYAPQLYIPTMAAQQHHSTHLMQQPLHQMDVRHPGRRVDTGNSGSQRSQAANQAKAGTKQSYQASYWNQA